MIRLPRSVTVSAALLAPFALVACAAPPPPAASPEPPPPGVFAVGQHRELSPIDGEMVALAHAEEEIDRAFPPAAERAGPRKSAEAPSGAAPGHRDEEQKPAPLAAKDQQLDVGGDRCSTACKALSSMASSAERLCKLAGETDGRCEDAQARVRGATSRVKSSCPTCSISIAAPPPPAQPKPTAPSGPAPGMPGSSVPIP